MKTAKAATEKVRTQVTESPVVTVPSANPFLDMRREFKAFIENRFMPNYRRLSDPNNDLDDVNKAIFDMQCCFDVHIVNWEEDITAGTLKPMETTSPVCALPMADLGGDPFYQAYCRLDKIERDIGTAWDTFKDQVDEQSLHYVHACDYAIGIAKENILELSKDYVSHTNDGYPEKRRPPHTVHPLALISAQLWALKEMIDNEVPSASELIRIICDSLDDAAMKNIEKINQAWAKKTPQS